MTKPTTDANFHQTLRELVQEVCQYPAQSPQRRKGLNRIVRLIQQSGKLWRENTSYYEDALQETWLYFSRNLCEATTSRNPYNPEEGSVITWLNAYLRRRLQDWQQQENEERVRRANSQVSKETGELLDPLDTVPAKSEAPSLVEEIEAWVVADETGELQRTHIHGHPEVNCQVLILRRLPPETKWRDLAAKWGLSISTLSGFYEKQCRPRLKEFVWSEGYL
ncbi:sigma-70 family RNA polymerase sigma factor [Floridanema evergladense]